MTLVMSLRNKHMYYFKSKARLRCDILGTVVEGDVHNIDMVNFNILWGRMNKWLNAPCLELSD